MKFGVEIPGTVEEEVSLDKKNDISLWKYYIKKDMDNSRIAFKILEKHGKTNVGYTEITCHLEFELKLDMAIKAWYIAGGYLTDVPTHMTYSSVVSFDNVRIVLLMSALNVLDIIAGDIQNTFLEAPTE